ncbi:CBS domain-containing protein [Streptomyces sp. NPDC050610]|uniref:CBS domain-containing protein n=1 Tax=Streptomyces sp. NPDC050610 TaxID=3157097 RepID=UPI00344660C4
MRAWVVRAGTEGEREEPAFEQSIIAAGWPELGDITKAEGREDLRALLTKTYPDYNRRVIGNWAGQLLRFRHVMKVGDLVVLPRRNRQLAVGRIMGDYVFHPDAVPGLQHIRRVEWKHTALERQVVKQDLLYSMGSLMTVFELRRANASERVATLFDHGADPGPAEDESAADSPPSASAALLDKAVNAPVDQPLSLKLHELIEAWPTGRMSSVLTQIEADLHDQGLTASPLITVAGLQSTIKLLRTGAEPGPEQPQLTTDEVPDEEAEHEPLTYRVNHLATAASGITSIRIGETLKRAITVMAQKNISQLPVLDEHGRLCGAVTWESIGESLLHRAPTTLAEVTVRSPLSLDGQSKLLASIDQIHERGYAFVHDKHVITGIITTADVTAQFGTRVEPFVLLEELEQRLRRLLHQALENGHLTLEQIRSTLQSNRKKRVNSPDDLTLGEYPYVLAPKDNWDALKCNADQQTVRDSLTECAKFRNELMHFDPTSTQERDLAPVQGALKMLRALHPID